MWRQRDTSCVIKGAIFRLYYKNMLLQRAMGVGIGSDTFIRECVHILLVVRHVQDTWACFSFKVVACMGKPHAFTSKA